jgi:hypothetical protein
LQKKTRIQENAKKRAKSGDSQQTIVATKIPMVPRWEDLVPKEFCAENLFQSKQIHSIVVTMACKSPIQNL